MSAITAGAPLTFDPEDPFPLLADSGDCGEASGYAEAKEHAAHVDAWLGLDTAATEARVRGNPRWAKAQSPHGFAPQYWVDLPVAVLQTPYTELRAMLSRLDPHPGETVIDLGAGYGRLGCVVARHHPGVSWIGYEIVVERVEEGRRCLARAGRPDITLEPADLSAKDFSPASAAHYFLYDFGSRPAIEKTLHDLRHIAAERPIAVVARGRGARDAIDRRHPWLGEVCPPEHHAHYSIYRSGYRSGY